MRRRRERSLSPTELALWREVARSVRPLTGRLPDALPDSPPEPAPALAAPPPSPPAAASRPAVARPAAPPPLAPLERRLRTRLRRGSSEVESALDLHGLRQDEAHDALRAFLRRAQAQDRRLVLVVTGKSAPDALAFGEARGVLRRQVPHWLRLPDLRPLVLGFDEAEQRHGGAGALYVRLRRAREAGP